MRARIFAEHNRKWLTLAAVSFGLFMIMLDNTVVNVALPSIQRDLDTDLSELQWIVTGYALTFAALMLVGGKVADAYGRRLTFVVGIAVFTAASLLCGLADSGEMLIAARVLQGVGAALMNPATLSIIAATFPPRERGTAIGIWAGVSALALAIGPLVGGLITEHLDWSWIFFVNVPVGILGIAASYLFIDESRDETHVRLDLPGLATSGVGLFALTYGLIEANTYGWSSTRIVGSFVLAGVSLIAFVQLERRQRDPMLPLELFRSGTYTGANLVVLLVALAMFGVFFFVSLYLQNILGYSAVETGAAFLPLTILIILVAPIAGKTSDRIGSRGLMTAGMILIAAQLAMFSRLSVDASFWDLFPALVIGGIGMALTMTPSAAAATRSVSVDKAGVGSAVLNSARQVGGTMGIAVMGAIMAAEAGAERTPEAFMRGFEAALLVAAAIAVVGAIVAFVLVRPHEGAGDPSHAAPEPVGVTTPSSPSGLSTEPAPRR
ncbi:MAG TPA: MFS transporter [Gaiellaceae bacterium]|nr:MFS transporter [Gaiellaceae bacterium]